MSEGRRTRSTRAKPEIVSQELPTRTTRRGKKQNVEEEDALGNEDVSMVETTEIVDDDENLKAEQRQEAVEDSNGNENIDFDEVNLVSDDQEDEKQVQEVEEVLQQSEPAQETEQPVKEEEEKVVTENAAELTEQISDNEINNVSNSELSMDDVLMAEEDVKEVQDAAIEDISKNSSDCEMIEAPTETTAEDTLAQSEDIKQKDDQATDLDAENISEDELPVPTKPKVQDAEEVSDEELPGPKLAELPADTEIVSEEELPANSEGSAKKRKMELPADTEIVSEEELPANSESSAKKDGKRKLEDYDPSDPTEESDAPEKKAKTEDEEAEEKPKKLPELEKYWKAVKADNEDFTAWTYLLQYVDSENDIEAAREAYDSFLSRYCYCYGYWRKYADYEKKKGSLDKCDEVFERGLKAIPLSVDLWIHYLTHVKQSHQDDRDYIRGQFERALDACGLEFRSDKLWEGYIRWETEEKNFINVVTIYDRLLATPTQGYKSHMDNFRELVNNNPVQKLLSVEEFKKLREEVRKDSDEKADDEAPPGMDEADDHLRNEEEADAIRKLIISKRKKINKLNVEMINKRWTFEEGIKRPYFHVKQLEKIQLKNWKEYLDFEIEHKDKKRILVLFERCLIACALYEDFWVKLLRYLEANKDDEDYEERTRNVFERACCIHHQDKPNLHLMWATFEETYGNLDKASKILEDIEKKIPSLIQIAYRRINLERRRGNLENCSKLYEKYLQNAKNKNIASSLAIKYARFLNKIKHDYDKAVEILKSALEKDTTNTRLALQTIDLALQRDNVDEKEIVEILDKFMQQENLDVDQKLLFAQRKVEFLEDFGSSIQELQEAQKALQSLLEKSKESKKKASDNDVSSSKKSKESSASNSNPSYNSAYNYQTSYSNASYPSSNQWGGNYNYDYNQYSGSYYNSSSYGNYQHGSYGSY